MKSDAIWALALLVGRVSLLEQSAPFNALQHSLARRCYDPIEQLVHGAHLSDKTEDVVYDRLLGRQSRRATILIA
jgi:hypothetical protein